MADLLFQVDVEKCFQGLWYDIRHVDALNCVVNTAQLEIAAYYCNWVQEINCASLRDCISHGQKIEVVTTCFSPQHAQASLRLRDGKQDAVKWIDFFLCRDGKEWEKVAVELVQANREKYRRIQIVCFLPEKSDPFTLSLKFSNG